ncbi:hypothetical protein DOT_0056 [Desulfosporosinus sp. OT]|nr:hypothetical protein DOT_0056 [Desulfosporosinus sp. OT]
MHSVENVEQFVNLFLDLGNNNYLFLCIYYQISQISMIIEFEA